MHIISNRTLAGRGGVVRMCLAYTDRIAGRVITPQAGIRPFERHISPGRRVNAAESACASTPTAADDKRRPQTCRVSRQIFARASRAFFRLYFAWPAVEIMRGGKRRCICGNHWNVLRTYCRVKGHRLCEIVMDARHV